LAGFENGVTDNGVEHIAGYLSDAVSYYKEIVSKGGVYEFTQSPELGAAVLAAIEPVTPWTIARNAALSNRFATMYTLYWRGLVRGQLVNHTNAKTICDQLNLANVDGSETGGMDTALVTG